jgi:pectinesterase
MNRTLKAFVLLLIVSGLTTRIGQNCLAATLPPQIKPDITVAADGSGDFRTVAQALDSIPKNNTDRKFIFIKSGTYNEHIRVENSFLTFLGEDRLKTRLVWEINDPRNDPNANSDRKGIASFNLFNSSDIVIDNLTIDNPANKGLKPFVVGSTGQGTRIIIQNAEVLGLGGDSLSLWTSGMYYHRNIHATGTYHFVGPRGTCYMSDSLIEELGGVSNALFNDGKADERQKFVLHRCKIISKQPFGLGSNFGDAAWYFIDCQFPDTLKPDGKIFIAQSNVNNPRPVSETFKWATDRIYFAGSKGPDYPWLKDNIDKSPAKTASTISAAWTFWGQWDPEGIGAPSITGTTRTEDVVSVKFSESVTVKGKPVVKLADGKAAEYTSGSGTDTLTFKAPTSAAARSLELNGGAILASVASAQARLVADSVKLAK